MQWAVLIAWVVTERPWASARRLSYSSAVMPSAREHRLLSYGYAARRYTR